MIAVQACEALKTRRRLELFYDGYSRVVEVHAVGFTAKDNAAMSVWQVRGGSVSNEPQGWKIMSLAEVRLATITAEPSDAPRKGYNPANPALPRITCKIAATITGAYG